MGFSSILHRFSHSSAQVLVWVENRGEAACSCSSSDVFRLCWLSSAYFLQPSHFSLFLQVLQVLPPPSPPPLHSPLGLFCCATLRCFWGLMQIIINVFYSFLEYTSSWITVSGQELVPSSLNAILSFNALSKVKWKQTARNIAEWVSASHRPWCVLPYGKWVPCSQPQFPFPSNWFNNSICHIRTYVMDRIW